MTIEEIRELLRKEIVQVTFTKKDGSTRVMNCTTRSDYLPEMSSYTHVQPEGIVTVWDTDASGWRSFRFDTVKSINTEYFNYVV